MTQTCETMRDMRDNAAGEILIACAKELELGGTRPTGFKDLKQHILSLYNPQQETFSARFGLLVHIPSTSAVQFLTQVQKLMAVHQVMLTPEYARQTIAKLGNEFLRDSVQTDLRAFQRDHPETADTVTFSLLRRFIETWEANHPHQMQTYSKDRLQQRPTAPRSDDKYFSGRMTEAPRERYRGPRQIRPRTQSYDIDPKDMIPSPNTGKPIPGPRIRHRAQQGDIQESGSPSPSKEQRYNNRDKPTLSRHQVRDMQQNRNSQHTTAAVMTDDQYSEDEGSLVQSADHSVSSDEEYPWEDEYQYSVNAIFLRNSQEIAAGQKECDRMYAMYDSHHMTSEDDESMELSHVLYREWQSSKPKPFQPRFVTKPQVSTANPFQVLAVECDASPHDNTDTTTEYSDVLYQDLQGLPISNRFHNPLVVQDPQPLPVASVECDNNPHKTDTAMTAAITTRTKSGRPVKNPLARDSSVPNTGTQPPGESRHEMMDSSAGTNTPDTAAEDTTRTDARTPVPAVPQDTTRTGAKASRPDTSLNRTRAVRRRLQAQARGRARKAGSEQADPGSSVSAARSERGRNGWGSDCRRSSIGTQGRGNIRREKQIERSTRSRSNRAAAKRKGFRPQSPFPFAIMQLTIRKSAAEDSAQQHPRRAEKRTELLAPVDQPESSTAAELQALKEEVARLKAEAAAQEKEQEQEQERRQHQRPPIQPLPEPLAAPPTSDASMPIGRSSIGKHRYLAPTLWSLARLGKLLPAPF